MILHVKMFKREEAIINKMKEHGYPVPETVRQAIREYGADQFTETPLYAKVAAERLELSKKKLEERDRIKNMTPTEYAEQVLLGKVRENGRVEFRSHHGEIEDYSLFGIKDRTPENDFFIARHIQLVKRNYVYADGREPTEEKYKQIFKDW